MPEPSACIVGSWIGESNADEVFQDFIQSMSGSGVTFDAFSDFPTSIGRQIYADGFYITVPMHVSTTVTEDRETSSGQMIMDLNLPTEIGHIWDIDGMLFSCVLPGMSPTLHFEGRSDDGSSGSTDIVLQPDGYVVPTTVLCNGDSMITSSELPVGTVTVLWDRVPQSRFGEDLRARLESGGAGPEE
ncbi:hypothetical protein [Pelagovum pacificum]|uniref:Uncharacterized protein n=2 Tax=Pelagovum pacificum TaxID=2588711 RepID=A0A5C5GBL2_9RHOB|nr:hypothetical protein [Pelagovum pacificum]TNY31477.1 hypothetical protein FHY64_15815 [Pelagovum pacificum]